MERWVRKRGDHARALWTNMPCGACLLSHEVLCLLVSRGEASARCLKQRKIFGYLAGGRGTDRRHFGLKGCNIRRERLEQGSVFAGKRLHASVTDADDKHQRNHKLSRNHEHTRRTSYEISNHEHTRKTSRKVSKLTFTDLMCKNVARPTNAYPTQRIGPARRAAQENVKPPQGQTNP